METIAVIDFETTGLNPSDGHRATEIAAVLLQDGKVVDRYQSLMNAGIKIPGFITELTGITNAMVRSAPPASRVMAEVADFVGKHPLAAHNASFDRKFWDAELGRIGQSCRPEFVCSLLLARRILPDAPNHQLGSLAAFAKLPFNGRAHRAGADAEMAAQLLLHMEQVLVQRFSLQRISLELLHRIQKTPANQLDSCVARHGRP